MNLVWNEYVEFLRSNGVGNKINLDLKEGYYWLDNQIIKAFDTKGNIHKVYRIYISDDLKVSYKKYDDKPFVIESWDDTIRRYNVRLDTLEKNSISLLQSYSLNSDRIIIDMNSTGKDSMVKTYLAKKAGLVFDTYFNVTTMDVAESNVMAKNNEYRFIYPDKRLNGFYNWSNKNNIIPSRLNRACCTYFKEQPTIDNFDDNAKLLFLFGMRNSESNHRSGYEDVWVNNKWGNRDWIGILPIRQWTDLDIWLYTLREGIQINQKYKYGYNRVGCGIVCPNYSKSTWVLDKYWYPKLYGRWQNRLKDDFIKNYKWLIMNCTLEEYLQKGWNGGTYRNEPTDDVIREFAEYKEIDVEIAKRYFLRVCVNSCKNKKGNVAVIKDKDVLAMNMKLFGRNIEKVVCKKCMMKMFEWDKDEWDKKVGEFKESGCKLF